MTAGDDTAPPQDVYAVVMQELDRLITPAETIAERYMQAASVVRAIDAYRAAAGPRGAGGDEMRNAAGVIREALEWEDAPAVNDPDGLADFLSGWFSGGDYALISTAAGPRAGDTAPAADMPDEFGPYLHEALGRPVFARTYVAEQHAELDRLRSEAAALRAAGDALEDAVSAFFETWRTGEEGDHLELARDAWRSAAGSPTTDGPARVLSEERAAETADELPATLRTVEDVAAVCEAAGLGRGGDDAWGVNSGEAHVSVDQHPDDGLYLVEIDRFGTADHVATIYPDAPASLLLAAIRAAQGGTP